MSRLVRVEQLLGCAVKDVDVGALQRLVDGAIPEAEDLEFKSELYGSSDANHRSLAADVAALANAGGGLLVIGISGRDRAEGLSPVHLDSDEEPRMRQIIASLVAPVPEYEVRALPSEGDATEGFWILEVARSTRVPHAVGVSNRLGYPRRHGSTTRWLRESEVAALYRDRFALARGQLERVACVRDEGEAALREATDRECAWLTLAFAPAYPGSMTTNAASIAMAVSTSRPGAGTEYWGGAMSGGFARGQAGHRRIVVRLEDAQRRLASGILHLHSDGSVFAGLWIGDHHLPILGGSGATADIYVDQDTLVIAIYDLVRLACRHVVETARAGGEAVLTATLASEHATRLIHTTRFAHPETESLARVPLCEHTIDPFAINASPVEWSAASAMIATDLLQAFGTAEPRLVTPFGEVRANSDAPEWIVERALELGMSREVG